MHYRSEPNVIKIDKDLRVTILIEGFTSSTIISLTVANK